MAATFFVTGASGFIGKRLVRALLERPDARVFYLMRDLSPERIAALDAFWGEGAERATAVEGDLLRADLGALRHRRQKAEGPRRSFLPPRRGLRSRRRSGAGNENQCRGRPQRRGPRQKDRRRSFPSHEFDRGRRPLRGRVPRGHVRGGGQARPSLFRQQARSREDRAPGMRDPLADLSPRPRRRRFPHRRNGQDRRPLLFLQADPEDAENAAALGADDRLRGRPPQYRAGRFRRRRARSSGSSRRARRTLLPPDRSAPAPRRRHHEHFCARGACAFDDVADQRRPCSTCCRRDSCAASAR